MCPKQARLAAQAAAPALLGVPALLTAHLGAPLGAHRAPITAHLTVLLAPRGAPLGAHRGALPQTMEAGTVAAPVAAAPVVAVGVLVAEGPAAGGGPAVAARGDPVVVARGVQEAAPGFK